MNKNIIIHPEALTALKNYKLPPCPLPFGQVIAPIMLICDHQNGAWGKMEIFPYGPIPLAPTAKVFHYAQEIFEGMKAYKHSDGHSWLFRAEKNMARFNLSSERMAIPTVPEEMFMEAVETVSALCLEHTPSESGHSLYLRPFSMATEENLGVKPSNSYKFIVIASPSGAYFNKDSVPVFVEQVYTRACHGGIGNAKTGGNYAASLKAANVAKKAGHLMTLWLDAYEKRYIEELSGMNFFCVIKGELVTPKLNDTILDGITRDSLIELAKREAYKVREERLDIHELFKLIESGDCTEAFACGTAAIISPIECLGIESGHNYKFKYPIGPVAQKLRALLLDIQEGRREGPKGWMKKVERRF